MNRIILASHGGLSLSLIHILHQMEVVAAPARVDIRVAGVLLLGAFVMGFDGADGRPLVLFEP